MISYNICGNNILKNILSLIVLICIWILCVTSTEGTTVCSSENKGGNCSTACNVTCLPVDCNNETEECGECDNGLYGNNCSLECPSNCVGQICDYVTGDCRNGCIAGYQGHQCTTVCSKGYFGEGCKNECPKNCASNECHHETGYCLNGCKEKDEYWGNNCSIICSKGYFGEWCKNECPVNCASNECHHETGHCLNGCKDEYWGNNCSMNGEVKDNPEPAQQKFYSQLSAESKSVLLYVLMGKYEETLQRAQMEINRGIQQRNELRALMGGDLKIGDNGNI